MLKTIIFLWKYESCCIVQTGKAATFRGKEPMDKLRKFGAQLWRGKERMILGVLVVFLCQRVIVVREGPDPADFDIHIQPPTSTGAIPDLPSDPPPMVLVKRESSNELFVHDTPFLYRPGEERGPNPGPKFSLNGFADTPQGTKAWLKPKKGRARFFLVGEQVDQWKIERIQEEEGSVIVRNVDTQQVATLTRK
jgi:hypothetical protein